MADVVTDSWLKDFYRGASTAHLIAYAESLERDYPEAYRDGPERQEYVARRVPFKGRLFPV